MSKEYNLIIMREITKEQTGRTICEQVMNMIRMVHMKPNKIGASEPTNIFNPMNRDLIY